MARVLRKMALGTAIGVTVLTGGAAGYFYVLNPKMDKAPKVKVEMTEARIARGKYIFAVADCDGCHSERDFSRFNGPVVAGGRGKGMLFPKEMGLPGDVAAPNITPDPETGIGSWTDGEKIRAIREGVDREGRPLFPLMGYTRFRGMSDEDVYSLVAYLNSLPPLRNAMPKTNVKFPVSALIRTAPQPAGHVPEPDRKDPVKYGEYLTNIAGCAECHTSDGGDRFAGGVEFSFPVGRVVSANITPDPDTGIGTWSEDFFVSRFHSYRTYVEKGAPKSEPSTFTLMPWLSFSQMSEADLKAIYAYLKSQQPVTNRVDKHPPLRAAR